MDPTLVAALAVALIFVLMAIGTPVFAALALAGACAGVALSAQIFRTGTDTVLLSVTVSDSRNRPVPGLRRDDFVVFEDKTVQSIEVFASDPQPIALSLLLDSSRIQVMPLAGRSFHYKPLATTGDRESGQVIGEYTLEFRNENAHGLIYGLTA